MFWREKKRESRKWLIPENQIEKFLKLYDSTDEESYHDMYILWKFIIKIIPELEKELYTADFNINLDCILQPFIEKIIKKG